jgi:hypothetical protein
LLRFAHNDFKKIRQSLWRNKNRFEIREYRGKMPLPPIIVKINKFIDANYEWKWEWLLATIFMLRFRIGFAPRFGEHPNLLRLDVKARFQRGPCSTIFEMGFNLYA